MRYENVRIKSQKSASGQKLNALMHLLLLTELNKKSSTSTSSKSIIAVETSRYTFEMGGI